MAIHYAFVQRPVDNSTVNYALSLDAAAAADLQGELLADVSVVYPAPPTESSDWLADDLNGPIPVGDGMPFWGSAQRVIASPTSGGNSEQIVLYTNTSPEGFVVQYTADSPLVLTGGDSQLFSYGGRPLYSGGPINALSIHFSSFGNKFTLPDGHFSISALRIWGVRVAPEPEPTAAFWTRLVGTSETLSASGPSPGVGNTPESATVVPSLPYSATLGAISGADVLWFKVTLGAGAYRFHTTDSPDPEEYDTHIALFSAAGTVIAENDDADGDNLDYRSSITATLAAGDYYIAMSGYGTTFGSGFSLELYGKSVPSGAIFKIEAA